MSKNLIIILFSIILGFVQSSLYINNIRINFIFLFFVYLLFFHDINYALLSIFASGLTMDLFAITFGGYFVSLFIASIILYYIYRNILSGDRFFAWALLNFIGILIFNLVFYIFNIVLKIFTSNQYIFNSSLLLREFIFELIFTMLCSVIFYFLINLFSKRTRDRLIIIGN